MFIVQCNIFIVSQRIEHKIVLLSSVILYSVTVPVTEQSLGIQHWYRIHAFGWYTKFLRRYCTYTSIHIVVKVIIAVTAKNGKYLFFRFLYHCYLNVYYMCMELYNSEIIKNNGGFPKIISTTLCQWTSFNMQKRHVYCLF